MTPEQASAIAQFYIPLIEQESATTRKVLAAVPDQGSDYKPDEKSMTGAELATHIASADSWFLNSLLKGEFMMDGTKPPTLKPSEALAQYEAEVPGLIARLRELTPEQLSKPATFVIWTQPLIQFFAIYLNHSIHHRGQLSAYIRPMGGRVPSIYGGSADEPFEMPKEAEASA